MHRSYRSVVLGIAVVACIAAQPYRLIRVQGLSMSPTYKTGNLVLTSRYVSQLRHGDVVVFDHNGEALVKRVAFLPGDRILQFEFRGKWMTPGNEFMIDTVQRKKFPKRYTTVAPGHLYVLGDNLGESVDSRIFGQIPASSVIGKVCAEPKPELIEGYAGSAQIDEDTSQLVTRRIPMTRGEYRQEHLYLTRLEHPGARLVSSRMTR